MVPGRQALDEGAMVEKGRCEVSRAMHGELWKSMTEVAR